MLDRQIRRYEKQIAEEEILASKAATPDLALAHHQAAMLYQTELAIIQKRRTPTLGDTLADIW